MLGMDVSIYNDSGEELLTGEIPVPPEGSILPDTYSFERGQSRKALVEQMQAAMDRFVLKVPVVGGIVRMIAVSRFSKTLSTLLGGLIYGWLDWRTASQKYYALAPYPDRFEGWADALPSSVGVADMAAGIVRCKGFLDAVTYLSRRSRITRSSRDPDAFRGL